MDNRHQRHLPASGPFARLVAVAALVVMLLFGAVTDGHGRATALASNPTPTVVDRESRPGMNPVGTTTVVDPDPARPGREPATDTLPASGTGAMVRTPGKVSTILTIVMILFALDMVGVSGWWLYRRHRS